MQAREIMTKEPICCSLQDNNRTVARQMAEYDCEMLPVVNNLEERQLVAILTDRDIVCRICGAEGGDCNAAAV